MLGSFVPVNPTGVNPLPVEGVIVSPLNNLRALSLMLLINHWSCAATPVIASPPTSAVP